jgi:soluble lytic murein transglycosylase-like protein
MAYTRAQLEEALYAAADRYGIRRDVAWRQIDQESGFNPNAVSPAGAQGIAQFMPDTAARFGLSNPFDPIASFDAWGRYMRLMLDMFGERYDLALAGYNSGENREEYKSAARENRPVNWSTLPARVQQETPNYVSKILAGLPTSGPEAPGGAGDESNSNWLLIGAVVAIALVALGALDD